MALRSKFATWCGNSVLLLPSIISISRSSAAKYSVCLGPMAPERPRRFACSADCCRRAAERCEWPGVDLRRARASARQRIGYVAQKFSLYGQLSVAENLEFFASAYSLRGAISKVRIDWAMRQFDLGEFVDLPSGDLPGGFKQRLAMAAALLHEPRNAFPR